MTLSRRLVLALPVALALTAVPAAAGSVAAADPPGTVVLNPGPSAYPAPTRLTGATPGGVVLLSPLRFQPFGSDPAVSIDRRATSASVAGSRVLYDGEDGPAWYDTATGARAAAPATWVAAAPTGGLLLTPVDASTTRLQLQDAATGQITDLADVPAVTSGQTTLRVVSGPAGAVVSVQQRTFGVSSVVVYAPYDGGPARTYNLGAVPSGERGNVACVAPSTTTIACFTQGGLYTTPISASRLRLVAPFSQVDVGPALTSGAVVWVDPADRLVHSVPVGGGTVSMSSYPTAEYSQVVSDTVRAFVVADVAPPGIGALTDATTPPELVAPVALARIETLELGIDAGGRVYYLDTRRRDTPLWIDAVTRTGGTVVVDDEQLSTALAGLVHPEVVVGGARLSVSDSAVVTVTSPFLPTFRREPTGYTSLSGNRLALFASTRSVEIADLTTGRTVRTRSFGDGTLRVGSLFGDFYTYVRNDYSVWRYDLASGRSTQVLATVADQYPQSVATWGDWVAVSRRDGAGRFTVQTVNLRTGESGVTDNPKRTTGIMQVGPAGFVIEGRFTPWRGSEVYDGPLGLVADADVMAWVGSDGRARVAPLPAGPVSNPPLSLGLPVAPPAVATGGTWTFDLPTSAALTTCEVRIARAGRLVRALPCDPAYTRGGDAAASWDTTDATGQRVRPGAYTWTVVAAGDDGPLALPVGALDSTTGTVKVTAA